MRRCPSIRVPAVLMLVVLVAGACGGTADDAGPTAATGPDAPAATARADESTTAPPASLPATTTLAATPSSGGGADPADADAAAFPVVDVDSGSAGAVSWVRIPSDPDCTNITATPTLVGRWLVYPDHRRRECTFASAEPDTWNLYGYDLDTGHVHLLYAGAAGEAPLLHDEEAGVVWWPTTLGGTVQVLDDGDFSRRNQIGLGTTADGAGTLVDGVYYQGTVNGPDASCQQPINPACGALFAVDREGRVLYSRTTDDGFRAWVGTGVVSVGDRLYWGTAAQTVGEKSGDETEYLGGCSVVETDLALNIVATFDPGDLACYKLDYDGANEDSVAGEVVPDGAGLWALYVRPNDADMAERGRVALYRLGLDLTETCRVEFPWRSGVQTSGFYAAPTVDAEGRAFVAVTVPGDGGGRRAQLWRVTPDCGSTLLVEVPDATAWASPTLADDSRVLFATDGALRVVSMDGEVLATHELGSDAVVQSSPVIVDGTVYVVQEDGTVDAVAGTGVEGYGSAIWPRYRHDDAASARLG